MKNLRVDTLVESLISQEFVVDPKVAALTKDLSEILRSQFRFVDSIIVLGSSVHGGASVRNVMGGGESGDLDWGLIYRGEEPRTVDIRTLVDRAESYLPYLVKKHNLPLSFESCIFVNPHAYSVPRISTYSEALKVLNEAHKEYKGGMDNMLYFVPSFPASSNVENRRMVLNALAGMFKGNESRWKTVIDNLMRGWQDDHRIKEKHITRPPGPDRKFERLRTETARTSYKVMDAAMRALLESTSEQLVQKEPRIYIHNPSNS